MIKPAYIFVFILMLFNSAIAQVAINESNPSSAASLHLEAHNNTTNFGGFLMPVVTEAQQALIPVSTTDSSDDGLMVYVSDTSTGKHCWEIYDGIEHVWRSINCQNKPCSEDILYQENFNSYIENTGVTGVSNSNGNYPSGVTKWTLTSFQYFGSTIPSLPGTLLNANDYGLVKNGKLELRDLNGVFRFETESIDISGYSNIQISMSVSSSGDLEYDPTKHSDDFNCGNTLNDYVDIEYSTNGGISYVEVPNFSGNGNSNHTLADDLSGTINFSVNGISGASLILRIRIQNWADEEKFYIDNIEVKCI